jgi:acyl-coenzyme A thioesterase PaaI-like protein
MPFDIDSLAEGLELPTFQREGDLLQWVRYAAVNPVHKVGHHFDDEVARREGFDSAFIMAPLEHAYVHAMLREWMGHQGRVLTANIRLRRPLLRGRTLTAGGTVTSVRRDESGVIVELTTWEKDDLGELLAPGTATVFFPRDQ